MNNSSYIWLDNCSQGKDIYRVFRKVFNWEPEPGKPAVLKISADSSFAVYINGIRCPIAQTAEFPADRTYSELDVTEYLHPGKNVIAAEVYFIGDNFLTYRIGTPFLRAEITQGTKVICATDKTWKSSIAEDYVSGTACRMTLQLGFVYEFDARRSSQWKDAGFDDSEWQNAFEYHGDLPWKSMVPRHVPQLQQLPLAPSVLIMKGVLNRLHEKATWAETCFYDGFSPRRYPELFDAPADITVNDMRDERCIDGSEESALHFLPILKREKADGFYVVLDLKKEQVGFFTLKLNAPAGTIVDICHGEHLNDGRVRSYVNGRNFTDRYICKEGMNDFTHYHRRLGGRYIELHITNCQEGKIDLLYAGLIPLELPVSEQAQFSCADRFIDRCNELSVETLKLCMHEHYEDCPWREQGLYAYDSRNQIMYGYYVWGNYDFAAASIDMLGRSFDGERYLTLTSPGYYPVTIPIFTFAWIIELWENCLFSGSAHLFDQYREQIDRILDRALSEKERGYEDIYHPGCGKNIWNFCEWSGKLGRLEGYPQSPYNIYMYEALTAAAKLHELYGSRERCAYLKSKADSLGKAVEKTFFNQQEKCYEALLPGENDELYEHIQMVMLANGLVPEDKKEALRDRIFSRELMRIDLSALYYLLEAMMNGTAESREYLTSYLSGIFEPIVFSNATSLWESRSSGHSTDDATSLCHAWSSVMPCFCGRYILGIRPLTPGFRKFLIKPFDAGLTKVSGEVPTPYGMIRVAWEKHDGKLLVKLTHPAETLPVFESYDGCPAELTEVTVSNN